MTNPINLEETYCELSKLLKDLCSFLSTEVQNGTLSSDAAKQAQNLLQRIQKQEEVISEISTIQEFPNSNYPYLQMHRPVLMEEPLSIYVDADNIEEEMYELTLNEKDILDFRPPSPSEIDTCPYLELPATSLPDKAVKYGPLVRKEKYFIIEQKKHLIVGLVGCWLLIYNANKKDMKPIQAINMLEYRAQIKKEPVFEIVSDSKKTHEFTAKSAKDMDQWIVAINCKIYRRSNGRNLPDLPANTISRENTKDHSISLSSTVNDNESEIYENIDETRKHETDIEEEIDAPKLPARKTNYGRTTENYRGSAVNSFNKNNESNKDKQESVDEEEEDFYDELRIIDTTDSQNKHLSNPPLSKMNSFSENNYDNEENSYDTPPSPIYKNNGDSEEEEVEYDELKFNSQTNHNTPTQNPEQELNKTLQKPVLKPIVILPKPKNAESKNYQEKNYNSPTSTTNKIDSEDEEVEYDELKFNSQNSYDLSSPSNKTAQETNKSPKKPELKPLVILPKPKNNLERNISSNSFNSPTSITSQNNIASEDEEEEYDELKFSSSNKYETSTQSNKPDLEIRTKSPQKSKPTVTSPKPKNIESRNSQEKSKIHNIIQQMEAASFLKKKK